MEEERGARGGDGRLTTGGRLLRSAQLLHGRHLVTREVLLGYRVVQVGEVALDAVHVLVQGLGRYMDEVHHFEQAPERAGDAERFLVVDQYRQAG